MSQGISLNLKWHSGRFVNNRIVFLYSALHSFISIGYLGSGKKLPEFLQKCLFWQFFAKKMADLAIFCQITVFNKFCLKPFFDNLLSNMIIELLAWFLHCIPVMIVSSLI